MVYKLRNKGFNNFNAAQSVRVYPAKSVNTDFDMGAHITLQVHITRYTGMRILHNYRNISRATKQFMMGDRFLEQLMILSLRDNFFRPMHYQAPIENNWYLGRSLADLTDRHYALFALNQHPLQLHAYQEYNSFLAKLHDKNQAKSSEEFGERFNQVCTEREAGLRTTEGESLSLDDLSDVYMQVKGEQREAHNMSLNTRDKKGDIADYLEARRPWGTAQ